MLALLLPLALVAPQSVDHSVLHPADALVYFEMADVQGVYRAYEGTAYGMAMADPKCQAALEKLLREEEGALKNPGPVFDRTLDMMTDNYWSKLKPVLGQIAVVSVSVGLDGVMGAGLFEGMEDEGFWDGDLFFTRLEKALRVQLVVDFNGSEPAGMAFGALSEAVAMLPENAGIVVGNGTYQGRPVAHLFADHLPDSKMPAGVFQDGSRVVFELGADPIVAMEAGQRREDKITSKQRFDGGQRHFLDQSAGLTVFQFQSKIGEAFYGVCPQKKYIQPIVDLIVSALGPDFDMLLRGGDWRVQLRNGVFVTESFQRDLALGPYDRLITNKPLNRKALDSVQDDAVIASGISVDTGILVDLLKGMASDLGEDPFSEWREKYDFRLEEELLRNLGSTWVSSLPLDSIGVTSLPGLSVWIDLKDRPSFLAGMEKLVEVVNSEAGDELVAKGKTYQEHRLYTFRGKDARGPEAMLQPTVVVFEDRILIGISRSRAQNEIKRALASDTEASGHEFFNSKALTGFFSSRGLSEDLSTVEYSFADWAKVLGRLYKGTKNVLLPMMRGGMSADDAAEFPVDLSALPAEDLFTRFFQPAIRTRVRVEDGLVMHSTSSFGPEMSGVIAGSMLTGFFFAVDGAVYSSEEYIGDPVELEPVTPHEHTAVPESVSDTELPK